MMMRCSTLRRVLHSLFLFLALVAVYCCVCGQFLSVAAAASVSEGFSVPEKQQVFDNSIFAYIEKLQLEHWNKHIKKSNNNNEEVDDKNGQTFGRLLDAGTGIHSLRWISTLAPSFTKNDDNKDNNDRDGNNRDGTQRQRRRRQQRHPSNQKTHPGGGITEFIAITSSHSMQQRVQKEMDELELNDVGLVHNGNWFPTDEDDDDLSVMVTARHNKIVHDNDNDDVNDNGDKNLLLFDTIIVDYLIGAMDAFSPYKQDVMIEKLARLLKPGTGRLYIDGMSPIPDSVSNPDDNLFCQITKLRDACIQLVDKVGSVQRPYREFPLEWMERQITNNKQASSLLELVPGTTKKFPITYTHASIVRQLDTARSKLKFMMNNTTRAALTLQLDDLEQKAKVACQKKSGGRLNVGSYNYVVVAQRRKEGTQEQEQETTTNTKSSNSSKSTTSSSARTETSTSTSTSFFSSYFDSWKEKSDALYATMEDQDLLVPLLVVVFFIVMVTVLLLSVVTVLVSVVVMMMMMVMTKTAEVAAAIAAAAASNGNDDNNNNNNNNNNNSLVHDEEGVSYNNNNSNNNKEGSNHIKKNKKIQ